MAKIEFDAERQKILDLFKLGNIMVFGDPKSLPPEVRRAANGECVVTANVISQQRTYVDLIDRHTLNRYLVDMPVSKNDEMFIFAGRKDIGLMAIRNLASVQAAHPRVIGSVLLPETMGARRPSDYHVIGREITESKKVKGQKPVGQIETADLAVVRQFGQKPTFVPHILSRFEGGELVSFNPERHSLKPKSLLDGLLAA